MIDDAPQAYNPIIQAMIATAHLQKQGQQQQIEKEKNKAEEAARKEQLKQSQQILENVHKHNLAAEEVDRMHAEVEHERQRIATSLALQQQHLTGTPDPLAAFRLLQPVLDRALQKNPALQQFREQVSSQINPEMPDLQGGQPQTQGPTNTVATPTAAPQAAAQPEMTPDQMFGDPFAFARKQNEVKAEGAGAVAKAEAEGKLPSELKIKDVENRNKLAQIGVQKDADKEIAAIHGDYQNANARINGAFHLQGISLMHQLGLDDGSGSNAQIAKSLLDNIYDGTTDYNKLTPDQKRVVTGYAQGTGDLRGLPQDGKAYGAKLDAVSRMQTLLDQYRDLAANYSRDSQGAFAKGNQSVTIPIVGTLQRTPEGSDLDSKIKAMKASGGALATFFDQQNRKSDAEILRQVIGSFDPKATAAQNGKKLEQHTDQMKQIVKQTFVGMSPDRVNKVLGDRNLTDFGAFTDKDVTPQYTNIHQSAKGKIGLSGGKWFNVDTNEEIK